MTKANSHLSATGATPVGCERGSSNLISRAEKEGRERGHPYSRLEAWSASNQQRLGFGLEALAAKFLGQGDWTPIP
jgi:hypothetical protein